MLCLILVSIAIFAAVTWAVPATTTDAAADAKNTPPSNGAAVWKPGQTLEFRVINAKTKEPLSGVKLKIDFSSGEGHDFWDKESTQTTDAQGRAKIKTPNRRIDEVRIYPSKPGFVPLRVYWGSKPAPLVIPQSVTVPLEPGNVWGGVVRNEQGNPISGATVKVRYWQGVSAAIRTSARALWKRRPRIRTDVGGSTSCRPRLSTRTECGSTYRIRITSAMF